MWKIENGILQKDGKGVYAMGLSGYENCYMIDQDGAVYECWERGCWQPDRPKSHYLSSVPLCEVLERHGVTPHVEVLNSPYVITNLVKGEGYFLVSLNNIKTTDEPVAGVRLKLNLPHSRVEFMTGRERFALPVKEGVVELPPLTHGGMLYIKE